MQWTVKEYQGQDFSYPDIDKNYFLFVYERIIIRTVF